MPRSALLHFGSTRPHGTLKRNLALTCDLEVEMVSGVGSRSCRETAASGRGRIERLGGGRPTNTRWIRYEAAPIRRSQPFKVGVVPEEGIEPSRGYPLGILGPFDWCHPSAGLASLGTGIAEASGKTGLHSTEPLVSDPRSPRCRRTLGVACRIHDATSDQRSAKQYFIDVRLSGGSRWFRWWSFRWPWPTRSGIASL